MTLLTQILKWSEAELALWQRDALRRLLVTQALSAADYEDICALLKTLHGLGDPKGRSPVPLDAAHLPATTTTGAKVLLLGLRDLTNVNRIATKQALTFSKTGLTMVYGGNGAGKSGYSRVLKRACRARDDEEGVYPNVFEPGYSKLIPQAVFDVEVDGKAQTVSWKADGALASDDLSGIAVFDSHCARSYIDDEEDVAFLPYGLHIVEALAREVMPRVSALLDAEIAAISTDATPFNDLLGATAVGKYFATLNENSDSDALRKLGEMSPLETARLAELNSALSEPDPLAKARGVRLSASRLDTLADRIADRSRWVSDGVVAAAKVFDSEAEAAIEAEKLAAEAFRAGETLLPGTGGSAWQVLLGSARRFSAEAYIGVAFPVTVDDAKCVLCQQPLSEEAAGRLKRFDAFVQEDVAKIASAKTEERAVKRQKMTSANLDFGLDAALTQELADVDPPILAAVQAYQTAINLRREWLVGRLEDHTWGNPPTLGSDPIPMLKSRAADLVAQATELERAADPKAKEQLESERRELAAKDKLRQRLKPAEELLARIKLRARLSACRTSIKTRAVSDKAKELASAAITGALKTALDDEFAALGIAHIKTKIKERAEQGAMKHKLVLDPGVAVELGKVLSEGEQRAVAIGSFLAELTLGKHAGGIVFDDPVSSLDHLHRIRVAKRLVDEAKTRQVIVFTHDTVFLGEVIDLLDKEGVTHTIHHLERIGESCGHVAYGLPWVHKSYKERFDYHEQVISKMIKSWPAHPTHADQEAMARQYSRFRATIERVVQDVVFNGVVRRYRDWIQVSKLDDVAGLLVNECHEIIRLYERCNGIVEAHDPVSAKGSTSTTPIELQKDLDALKAVVASILSRR